MKVLTLSLQDWQEKVQDAVEPDSMYIAQVPRKTTDCIPLRDLRRLMTGTAVCVFTPYVLCSSSLPWGEEGVMTTPARSGTARMPTVWHSTNCLASFLSWLRRLTFAFYYYYQYTKRVKINIMFMLTRTRISITGRVWLMDTTRRSW